MFGRNALPFGKPAELLRVHPGVARVAGILLKLCPQCEKPVADFFPGSVAQTGKEFGDRSTEDRLAGERRP
jgi:hypothetical protein